MATLGIIFRKRFLRTSYRDLRIWSDRVRKSKAFYSEVVGRFFELKILLFKFLYTYFHLEYSSHFSKMLAFCLIEALLTVSLRKQPTFRDLNTGFPAN